MTLLTTFSNAQACLSWLQFLTTKNSVRKIIGTTTNELLMMAGQYDTPAANIAFFAEAPLLGDIGVDLSAQYPAICFTQGNPLRNSKLREQGRFFQGYVDALKQVIPKVIPNCHVYLETDTGSGSQETSCFVNLYGDIGRELIPQMLRLQGMEHLSSAIERYLKLADPDLGIWHLGFMLGRAKPIVRLVLCTMKDKADIKGAVLRLDEKLWNKEIEEILENLDSANQFNKIDDIDILPDGSLGNMLGLEFNMKTERPEKQAEMFRSEDFEQFIQKMKQKGMADERLDGIRDALFWGAAPDKHQCHYYMCSQLSHFKLRWENGKALPAKVYLQMSSSIEVNDYEA